MLENENVLWTWLNGFSVLLFVLSCFIGHNSTHMFMVGFWTMQIGLMIES